MKEIELLKNIAEELQLEDILIEVQNIETRLNTVNKEIIIPIVGEFSSGKTTLINALSEGKKLETSSKPTTSVIYEIYFANDSEKAEIIDNSGNVTELSDIKSIKNENLNEIKLIRIFDTNKSIDKNTILVDTPGLSSNDSKHLEALSNYLPNADALILCIDINQQITNSLLEFIKFNNLAHLPLYLVITKSDTKTSNEIQNIKDYISKNINIALDQIIAISSVNNELTEFYKLIHNIQQNKNEIINNVLNYKLDQTKVYLKNYIQNLLNSSSADTTIENELKKQQRQLEKLQNAINRLIDDTRMELDDIENDTTRGFSRIIDEKLDQIISKKSADSDSQAIAIINSTSNLVLNNYQDNVRKKLYQLAHARKGTDSNIPLRSLESVNVSEIQITPLSYNIDLANAGTDQIKKIATGLKVVVGVAATGVAVLGAARIAATAATAASGALQSAGSIATAANVVDTATDVANIASNRKTRNIITQAQNLGQHISQTQQHINTIENYNIQAGQIINPQQKQGFVENIVGSLGDSVLGKPQRRKIINDYLENSLLPEFKSKIRYVSQNLLTTIQDGLESEAQITINQFKTKVTELKSLAENEKAKYQEKINTYKNYITLLS